MKITDVTILPFLMMQLAFHFCRLKLHYASFEPTIRVLHEKHHALVKEKMLTSLERDRAVGKVRKGVATLKQLLIIGLLCIQLYMCTYVCLCGWVCDHKGVCIYGGQRTSCFICRHTVYLFWVRSFIGLELTIYVRQVDQWVPGIPVSISL